MKIGAFARTRGRTLAGQGQRHRDIQRLWETEHRAFGYPFDHRAGRVAEALQVVTALLRTGAVDFHGRYYQAPACELRPRGPSPSGPPGWVGAKVERMLRLAAHHADGYIAIWPTTPPT